MDSTVHASTPANMPNTPEALTVGVPHCPAHTIPSLPTALQPHRLRKCTMYVLFVGLNIEDGGNRFKVQAPFNTKLG